MRRSCPLPAGSNPPATNPRPRTAPHGSPGSGAGRALRSFTAASDESHGARAGRSQGFSRGWRHRTSLTTQEAPMHTSKRIATGLVSLGLVFGAGVGIAQAAQKASGSKTSATGDAVRRGPGPFGGAALADYLGLTAAQLRTELESGKTLAQVATAQGKTVA